LKTMFQSLNAKFNLEDQHGLTQEQFLSVIPQPP
jgi:hypothetical protein